MINNRDGFSPLTKKTVVCPLFRWWSVPCFADAMRTFFGSAAAVLASLAIPIGLIVLAVFPSPPPEEGDAYLRGVIGIAAFIPAFAGLLVIYHALGAIAARVLPIRPSLTLLVLSVLASAVLAALFLASGAPLAWDRLGDFAAVMALIWGTLVLGSTVQYFVCFKDRPSRKAPQLIQESAGE